jgi:signal transduction histidine kinase
MGRELPRRLEEHSDPDVRVDVRAGVPEAIARISDLDFTVVVCWGRRDADLSDVLRLRSARPDLTIVLVSPCDDPGFQKRATQMGATRIIQEASDPKHLAGTIHRILSTGDPRGGPGLPSLRKEGTLAVPPREEEVRRQMSSVERRFESLASDIAHDLRLPLRDLGEACEQLSALYGPSLEEKGRKCLARMEESLQRMEVLVATLLAGSRADSSPNRRRGR